MSMQISVPSKGYNQMRARDLRYRFMAGNVPALTYRESLKIVSKVAWQRYHRQFYSSAFRFAATIHDQAYAYLKLVQEFGDKATELRWVGIVNARYYEADQTVGDLKQMEDAAATALLAKQAWHNKT